jgi:hypothetical protein
LTLPEAKIGQLSQENVSSSTNSGLFRPNVTDHSGIMTEDSGQSRKSVTFNQNRWSRSVGTTGHVQTESPVNLRRNTQVECAIVNPLDIKMLTGFVRERFPLPSPYVVGIDLSGVIVEAGALVKTLHVGDRVIGRLEPGPGQGGDFSRVGAFAEYVSAPARHLALAPHSISLSDCAGISTAAGTAWQAVVEEGEVRGGQTVLIHAARRWRGQLCGVHMWI